MRKLVVAALVLTVLAVVVVNYSSLQSVVVASVLGTGGDKGGQGLGTPVPTPGRTVRPAGVPSPTSVASLSTEEASALLAKLKPRTSQGSTGVHEAPVQLPKRLSIPAIAVDTGLEYAGLAPDGAMDVPKDPNQVAWYRLGPRPGEAGNAVVAGHVDWAGKTAAFWRLNDLKPGDVAEITAADERKYQFVVQWQRWYDASQAPVAEVFGQTEGSELTLITCGGVFDQKSRQYLSRLVVRAVRR